MRNHFYFIACLIMSIFINGFGQYYKVFYIVPKTDVISQTFLTLLNFSKDQSPIDYEKDGNNEIVVCNYHGFDILDGSTFNKKYQINESYVFNGIKVTIGWNFYGFWDIDGDNEREAVVLASYYDSIVDWAFNGLGFVNIKSQTMEYFNDTLYNNFSPVFFDINNDGFIELITQRGILGHSTIPIVQKPVLNPT